VSCGVAPLIENAMVPSDTFVYTQQFEVMCESGYTVDNSPHGEASFVASCGANGSFVGVRSCKPISCGIPAAGINSTRTETEVFLHSKAVWKCKDGFSVDGTPLGERQIARQCLKTGELSLAKVQDCQDIDFCNDHACTANGVCTDSGIGAVSPGYTCQCKDGFEVKKTVDGRETCSADDCAGSPCGKGGFCTDLSKQGQSEGTYKCECQDGFEVIGGDTATPSCRRTACGPLPANIKHTLMSEGAPVIHVKTWLGEEPSFDPLYSTPILKSFDHATITCDEGYSTDGLNLPESKSFSVSCKKSGQLSRQILIDKECQPIRCDNLDLPSVPSAFITNTQENFYQYGKFVHFKCNTGFTIGGEVGNRDTFKIMCQKDGRFPTDHENCSPVQCPVEQYENAISSKQGSIKYDDAATYNCIAGFTVNGTNETQYNGRCMEDGKIQVDGNSTCLPVVCGKPAAQPHADLFVEKSSQLSEVLPKKPLLLRLSQRGARQNRQAPEDTLSEGGANLVPLPQNQIFTSTSTDVVVKCHQGFTLGGRSGGANEYSMFCGDDGKFVVSSSETCRPRMNQIKGEVTDAQFAWEKIQAAEIDFSIDGNVVANVTTDASGRYTANLADGKYNMTVIRPGHVTRTKEVIISSDTNIGGAADISMSQPLKRGDWRVILNWGGGSVITDDLDSHTWFGHGHTDWTHLTDVDPDDGIEVVLDRDDVDGYGPETSTFHNAIDCRMGPLCLMWFIVHNFTPHKGTLGESHGVVTVFYGDKEVFRTHIPPSFGNRTVWPAFTLDTRMGQNKIYPGAKTVAPWLDPWHAGQTTNWATTFNQPYWSLIPEHTLMYAMTAASTTALHAIDAASYYVLMDGTLECAAEDWRNFPSSGDISCKQGHYLAGLYRAGSSYDTVTGPRQLQYGWCCKVKELPEEWGTCHYQDSFKAPGLSHCGYSKEGWPTAMVGFHHEAIFGNTLQAFTKFKCCTLPPVALVDIPDGAGPWVPYFA